MEAENEIIQSITGNTITLQQGIFSPVVFAAPELLSGKYVYTSGSAPGIPTERVVFRITADGRFQISANGGSFTTIAQWATPNSSAYSGLYQVRFTKWKTNKVIGSPSLSTELYIAGSFPWIVLDQDLDTTLSSLFENDTTYAQFTVQIEALPANPYFAPNAKCQRTVSLNVYSTPAGF